MKINVLDLFCGAGGLSLGFKLADFNIIGGIDFDQNAIKTHSLNFKNSFHFCGDISSLSDEFIIENFKDKVDIIIGGPPCQGFSTANMWQSDIEKFEKNKLFFQFIRFVKLLSPKAFLMENVKQILTKDNGFVKKTMIKTMEELDYSISVEILNSSNYGVPQNRHRAFFVGYNNVFKTKFDFNSLKPLNNVTVGDALSDLYYIDKDIKKSTIDDIFELKSECKNNYQKFLRKNSNSILKNHNIKYPKDIVQIRMKHVPEGGNWKNVPTSLWETQRNNRHSSAYRRLDSNNFSVTIDTGHMNYFHPKYNRVPTIRESARIQSFPDDFIFLGNQGSQFRQVGNAVPPLMSKAIALQIKEDFKKFYSKDKGEKNIEKK